ncbi:MAG: hypothetical protein ACFFD1_15525 [Candidatus Thorarchaeota archaeon]
MGLKKYLDIRLLGLIGGFFLIISEFLSWFSGYSLIDLLFLFSGEIEYLFLYVLPIISGIICLIGTILILYKEDYRINTVIINFVGLGFYLVFLIEFIPRHFPYVIFNSEIGFYISVTGGMLILFDILNILLMKERE